MSGQKKIEKEIENLKRIKRGKKAAITKSARDTSRNSLLHGASSLTPVVGPIICIVKEQTGHHKKKKKLKSDIHGIDIKIGKKRAELNKLKKKRTN